MFRKFRIKTRLLISSFIMALFTLITGLTGYARLTYIANSSVKTVHNVTILNDIYDHNTAIDSGYLSWCLSVIYHLANMLCKQRRNTWKNCLSSCINIWISRMSSAMFYARRNAEHGKPGGNIQRNLCSRVV